MDIPRASRRDPRKLWTREDTGFTPWLEENIDRLNTELDTSFVVVEREKDTPTGFSIDLYIEDQDDEFEGVIEGQIEGSDHDHLGKLLTYSTAFETEIAVWIVSDSRYEHEKAIEWLNETTDKHFYLVKIEAIEIEGSLAPLFTPIAVPSPAAKEIGKKKTEPSERNLKQERFWKELLERSKSEYSFYLFDTISPKRQGWLNKASGVSCVKYKYRIRNEWADVGIYLQGSDKETHENIFEELRRSREGIEDVFGSELEWKRLEEKKACRIRKQIADSGLTSEERWDSIQDSMITSMQRLHKAFQGEIDALEY